MSELDWVTARHQCSLNEIFNQLTTQVQRDVETRQDLRGGPPHDFGFRVSIETNIISVFVEGVPGLYDSRHFFMTENGIEVRDVNRKTLLVATPTLNDEGECRLKVNGEEKGTLAIPQVGIGGLLFCLYAGSPCPRIAFKVRNLLFRVLFQQIL